MNDVLQLIGSAAASEIDLILWAAIQRKRELCLDWNFVFILLPKENTQERDHIIRDLIRQLNMEAEKRRN